MIVGHPEVKLKARKGDKDPARTSATPRPQIDNDNRQVFTNLPVGGELLFRP